MPFVPALGFHHNGGDRVRAALVDQLSDVFRRRDTTRLGIGCAKGSDIHTVGGCAEPRRPQRRLVVQYANLLDSAIVA